MSLRKTTDNKNTDEKFYDNRQKEFLNNDKQNVEICQKTLICDTTNLIKQNVCQKVLHYNCNTDPTLELTLVQ